MSLTPSQSIRRDDNNVIYGGSKEIPDIDIGIGTIVFDSMKKNGNNIAQIDAVTGQTQTYKEFLDKCIKTCTYIQSRGIKPNDTVSICSYSHLDELVPFFGALFAGAVVACTDPSLSLTDTTAILEQICPKIIFVSDNAVDLIEKVLDNVKFNSEVVVFGKSDKYFEFDRIDLINYDKSFTPHSVTNSKDTAVITFSSGSTSVPKAACLSHYGLLGAIRALDRIVTNAVSLVSSTLYWFSGAYAYTQNVLANATRIVISNYDEVQIFKFIETYKVSFMLLTPFQMISMAKNNYSKTSDTSSVRNILMGGSRLSVEQILEIRSLFPNAIVGYGYGSTESCGMGLSLLPLDDPIKLKTYKEKPDCIGRPLPFCTYKVIDVENEETLGPNQTGEIRIKTNFQMNGYYKQESSSCWDSEGFLKTGDLVYYDEDLNFFFVDRIKEVLKYRGWQISPTKLEGLILNHPAVKNVVVVGKLDPVDGDLPIAVIERKQPVSKEEIENWVASQVADAQRLRGVKFVDEIPVSVTGKNRRVFIKSLVNDDQFVLD